MDLFAALRHLASKVEKDVLSIQDRLDEPIDRRDSFDNSTALVVLKGLHDDLQSTLEAVETTKRSLQTAPDISVLSTVCRALLAKENTALDETNQFLMQYGYMPPEGTASQRVHDEAIEGPAVLPAVQPSEAPPTAQLSTPVAPLLHSHLPHLGGGGGGGGTPGRPLVPLAAPSPCPPTLATPGLLRQLRMEPLRLEEGRDAGSPVPSRLPAPPHLRTPGFRQLATPEGSDPDAWPPGQAAPVTPGVCSSRAPQPDCDAPTPLPEMPELTFSLKDLRNMALGQPHAAATPAVQRQPGFGAAAHGDGTSQTPKPTAAVPPTQAAAAAAAPPAWQDDDLDIPDLPELTFDVGMFAKLRVRDGLLNVPSAT